MNGVSFCKAIVSTLDHHNHHIHSFHLTGIYNAYGTYMAHTLALWVRERTIWYILCMGKHMGNIWRILAAILYLGKNSEDYCGTICSFFHGYPLPFFERCEAQGVQPNLR